LENTVYEVMSMEDLIRAKKTQRDKDWPMIRRLVEVDYLRNRAHPDDSHVRFWLREMRTPELLMEIAKAHGDAAREITSERPLLAAALNQTPDELTAALETEEKLEREKDRAYWKPLKEELERLRHAG